MSASKLKTAFIALAAVGVGSILFSFFIPGIENGNLESQYVSQTVMTPENEQKWANIPGDYGQDVFWNHYLFNATNAYDVFFKNAMPQFTKTGPYVYQEYDTYFSTWSSDNSNVTAQLL